MIDAPEPSIELNEQDAKKLELATVRLSTVQREVLAATKEMASLDEQVLNARKSKAYLDEQVTEATLHLEDLQRQRQEQAAALQRGETILSVHKEEHGKMVEHHTKKERELDERESLAVSHAKELDTREDKLVIREKQVETDRAEVENARNTFLDAIQSVTWR